MTPHSRLPILSLTPGHHHDELAEVQGDALGVANRQGGCSVRDATWILKKVVP